MTRRSPAGPHQRGRRGRRVLDTVLASAIVVGNLLLGAIPAAACSCASVSVADAIHPDPEVFAHAETTAVYIATPVPGEGEPVDGIRLDVRRHVFLVDRTLMGPNRRMLTVRVNSESEASCGTTLVPEPYVLILLAGEDEPGIGLCSEHHGDAAVAEAVAVLGEGVAPPPDPPPDVPWTLIGGGVALLIVAIATPLLLRRRWTGP